VSILTRIGNWLKDFLRWLFALWRWLREPRLVWLTTFILAIAAVGAFWLRSEPAFRWTGLGLQLLGIATVAWNIRGTRTLFGRAGTFAGAAQWWNQRPKFRASVAIAVGAGSTAISGGRARLDIWYNADPDAAIEARIDAAEKNLSRLRDRLNEFEQETEKSLARQTNALEQEKQARTSDDKDIREKLEAAQVGGLHISVAGVVWLVGGVIMSTVPGELACLANFLFP
jgi:hypothetical protein